MSLVDLRTLIPDVLVDMRYAGRQNIFGRPFAGAVTVPVLEESAATALVNAAEQLHAQHLRLVIWDAYRPHEVHQQLLGAEANRNFVVEDSNHCKGLAVDLTLATEDGELLDMGTDHDDFSARASANAGEITAVQRKNREKLQRIMSTAGFQVWPYEWWHFDYVGQ